MGRTQPERNERLQQMIELVKRNGQEWEKDIRSAVKRIGLKPAPNMPRTCSKPA